ncbi:MAG: hypothetical protein JSS02_02320 [Planctomycetes bacterium]|nr:hypothetical protein [Planctomycetota bacterium]
MSLRTVAVGFLVLIAVTRLSAAGTITYDWINHPSAQNGYSGTGTITIDDAGISATPSALTVSMILDWQYSLQDSDENAVFSLTSLNSSIQLSGDVRITSTSIYVLFPEVADPVALVSNVFGLISTSNNAHQVGWNAVYFYEPPFQPLFFGHGYYGPVLDVTNAWNTFVSEVGNQPVAAVGGANPVPESDTLTMSVLLLGVVGIVRACRRQRDLSRMTA